MPKQDRDVVLLFCKQKISRRFAVECEPTADLGLGQVVGFNRPPIAVYCSSDKRSQILPLPSCKSSSNPSLSHLFISPFPRVANSRTLAASLKVNCLESLSLASVVNRQRHSKQRRKLIETRCLSLQNPQRFTTGVCGSGRGALQELQILPAPIFLFAAKHSFDSARD